MKLHDGGDGGVEVEALHVVGDLLDGPVDAPAQLLEPVRRGIGAGIGGDARQPLAVAHGEAPHPVEEAVRSLDALVTPVQVLLGRGREQGEQTRGIRAVALDQLVRVHHVVLGLGHLGAVLDDHALGQQVAEGLVHDKPAHVTQDAGEEARVEQVQHRVLDAADVLVHGHPVIGPLPIQRLPVLVGACVAREVPR